MKRKVDTKELGSKIMIMCTKESVILLDMVEFEGLKFKQTKNGYNVMKYTYRN